MGRHRPPIPVELPFTYWVFGRPVSTRNEDGRAPSALSAWRSKIRDAALSRILFETKNRGYEPSDDRMEVRIAWLSTNPDDPTQPDVDNMLKPLIDVLNERIFVDDRQVHRIIAEKADLNSWPSTLDREREDIQDDPDYVRYGEVIVVRVAPLAEE